MVDLYKKYIRLSCRYASQLLVKRDTAPLTLPERLRLRWHLTLCDPCSRFGKQVRLLDTLLTRNMKDETVRSAPSIRPERREEMVSEIKKRLKI